MKCGKKLLTVVTLMFMVLAAHGADLALGSAAPEIQAKILDSGENFSLSQQRGKVVIVNFWASWCAPCKAEMPALQTYLDQHRAQGLEILAISMDEARDISAVRKIVQQFGFTFALKSEANYRGLGRIWRMPTTFVIDREGILRRNGQVGDAEISSAELEAVVSPLLDAR
jgi:thiol-disulfide isomerase/thioredoxin